MTSVVLRSQVDDFLDALADGASFREACKRSSLTRKVAMRRMQSDKEFSAAVKTAMHIRAVSLVDEIIPIADGTDGEIDDLSAQVLEAVSSLPPKESAPVVRALMVAKVQRDRLRFDARRWVASRWIGIETGAFSEASNERDEARIAPLAMRARVLMRDKVCQMCGKGPKDGVSMHVDHIIPHSIGGATNESNLQALCRDCNIGKGSQVAP